MFYGLFKKSLLLHFLHVHLRVSIYLSSLYALLFMFIGCLRETFPMETRNIRVGNLISSETKQNQGDKSNV